MTTPTLTLDCNTRQAGAPGVGVHDLDPDLVTSLGKHRQADQLLQSVLRVRVADQDAPGAEDLPDVCGRYQLLESGVRFIPYFPFEPGVSYRATFDPGPLGCPDLSEVLTLKFALPSRTSASLTQVKHVFPSSDSLPENLLRFYVCFSNSMQRGRAEEHIALLGPDGRPVPDVLYRPPVELWNRSMRHLTILLDPGRLKRGVGPNRELGPPLKAGQEYTFAIGSGMLDLSGRPLREGLHKRFHVTQAVREPIAVEQWEILPPATNSQEPLALIFAKPLDWALLWHAITIASEGGQPIDGGIAIDQGETRWSFTPASPWAAGSYFVRVAPGLEDVCGNNLAGAFDRPLRSRSDFDLEPANCSIPFHVGDS